MTSKFRSILILSLLSTAASPALAQAAAAPQAAPAEAANTLGEVVVTARRVSESMQRVPVSITAVTGETIVRNNIVQVDEIQRITPGLQVDPNLANLSASTSRLQIQG